MWWSNRAATNAYSGGFTNGGCLADTWMFDRAANAWEMVMAGNVPAAKKMLLLLSATEKCYCLVVATLGNANAIATFTL